MRRIFLCMAAILVTAFPVYSQQAALVLDHVDGVVGSDPIGTEIMSGVPLKFWFRFTNNTGANMTELRNGFRVYSPDGAVWTPITYIPRFDVLIDPYIPLWLGDENWPDWSQMLNNNFFINPFDINGSGADTISWGGNSKFPSPGIPNGFDTLVYLIETTIDPSQIGLTLCLDTSWTPPNGVWVWTSDTGIAGSVIPEWNGPFCWTIVNCCQGLRGNVNLDPEDKINISDLTYLTEYMFGDPPGPIPACAAEANVNGDPDGTVNISDLTALVCYLFCIPPGPLPPGCP